MEQQALAVVNQTAAALVLSEWEAREALARKIGLTAAYAADAVQRALTACGAAEVLAR